MHNEKQTKAEYPKGQTMTPPSKLDELLKECEGRLNAATPPDCGDNSCRYALKQWRGGMRTNGGCRCYKGVSLAARMYVAKLHEEVKEYRKLIDIVRLQKDAIKYYADPDEYAGMYCDEVDGDVHSILTNEDVSFNKDDDGTFGYAGKRAREAQAKAEVIAGGLE